LLVPVPLLFQLVYWFKMIRIEKILELKCCCFVYYWLILFKFMLTGVLLSGPVLRIMIMGGMILRRFMVSILALRGLPSHC
jgi:hypothetical protein